MASTDIISLLNMDDDDFPLPVIPTATARYRELDRLARRGKVVFRIWDSTSAIPLRARQNEFYGGFTARHADFQSMDAARFSRKYKSLWCQTTWVHHQTVPPIVLQHVSGKTFEDIFGFPSVGKFEMLDTSKEASPWISTTANLSWAMSEIETRLALDPTEEVHLAVIDLAKDEKEIRVLADQILGRYARSSKMERFPAVRIEVRKALVKVKEAEEVLFYGRILGTSYQDDLTFTAADSPLKKPHVLGVDFRHPKVEELAGSQSIKMSQPSDGASRETAILVD